MTTNMRLTKMAILGCAMLLLTSCSIFGWDPMSMFGGEAEPATPEAASSSSAATESGTVVDEPPDAHPAAPDISYLRIALGQEANMYLGKKLEFTDATSTITKSFVQAAHYVNMPPDAEDADYWRVRLPNRDAIASIIQPGRSASGATVLTIYRPSGSTALQFRNPEAPRAPVTLFDWVGNNIFLTVERQAQSGSAIVTRNEFFIFDTAINSFVRISAYGSLALEDRASDIHFLENPSHGGIFALAACTDSNLAGECREFSIALSNSQMIRDVATVPSAGTIEWGWKDPATLFAKQVGGGSGKTLVVDLAKVKWDPADVPAAVRKPSMAERYRAAQAEVTSKLTEEERQDIYQLLLRNQLNPTAPGADEARTMMEAKGVPYSEDIILLLTTEGREKFWASAFDVERAMFTDKLPLESILDLCLQKSESDPANIPAYVLERYEDVPIQISEQDFCLLRLGSQDLGSLDRDESFRRAFLPENVLLPSAQELAMRGSGTYAPRIMRADWSAAEDKTAKEGLPEDAFEPLDQSGIIEAAYKKALCDAVEKKTKSPNEKNSCLKLMVNRFVSPQEKYALGLCGTGKAWTPAPLRCNAVLDKGEKPERYTALPVPAQKEASIQGPLEVQRKTNVLWFDIEFLPENADGVLRVFIDDRQVGTIYERFVPAGAHTYLVRFETIEQGTHTIRFTADGLNAKRKSTPKVTNVKAGYLGTPGEDASPTAPEETSTSSEPIETPPPTTEEPQPDPQAPVVLPPPPPTEAPAAE